MKPSAHHFSPHFGIAGAAVLGAGLLALTSCGSSPQRTALDDYPVFHEEATEQDVPEMAHSDDLSVDMDLPADEVRWVGEHDQTDFYATVGPSDDDADQVVCLIIAAHELEVAGASCSPDPYNPTDPAVTVRVGATGGAVQAFLVPATTELEDAEGWHRASDYVVVLTDPSAQLELHGTVADDTDIVLRRISG